MSSSKPAFIATIIVFLLAVAAAVFAFLKISEKPDAQVETPSVVNTSYKPSKEIEDEMQDAAKHLIENNYTIIKLYITRGLPHKEEPYGNRPENDIYYADSDEYKTLEDIEKIVDDTFIPEEAERVKNNRIDGGKPYYGNVGRVYFDKNGELGIHADFEPDLNYPVNWTDPPPSYVIVPESEEECILRIKLTVNGEDAVIECTMHKLNGNWYLDRLIHYE